MKLQVHDEATLIYAEMIAPGRVAMGESFQFDVYYSKITAINQEDELRFVDTVILEPQGLNVRSLGVLGGQAFLGNLYVLTRRVDAYRLSERIHGVLRAVIGNV